MVTVCIDEKILNKVEAKLKQQARKEWRPRAFNPVKFTRYLHISGNEDVSVVLKFDIPGHGEQEVQMELDVTSKAPSPETE